MSTREIVEGEQEQGASEEIVYTLDCTNWGSSAVAPSTVSVVVQSVDEDANPVSYSDVTATVMPVNFPTVDGQVITFSPIKSLTVGALYRVEMIFWKSGNKFSPYAFIRCRR